MKGIEIAKNLKIMIIRIDLLIMFILTLSKICYGQPNIRPRSDTSYRKVVIENFINQVNDSLTVKGLDTVKTTYDAFKLHGMISVYIWTSSFERDDYIIIEDEYDHYCMIEIGIDPDE